jgi:hypothetical protein
MRMRQEVIRRSKTATVEEKVAYDVYPRPHFAYGVLRAAQQAKALGVDRISVIEFGCAGGNGLVALEGVADDVSVYTGVSIDIYGFDVGEGLPRPLDYRDLPYAWQAGQFKMDIPKLKGRLRYARLVIGDVSATVPTFLDAGDFAPIGFISFDLDFYTSTRSALLIFGGKVELTLPRVYCYFDDCIGPDHELHSEFSGELLAIKEFNEEHERMKLAPIHGLHRKRHFPAAWNDATYVLHVFDHPRYCEYLAPKLDMNLALRDSGM